MPARKSGDPKHLPITSEEVRHLAGPVADDTILAILNCGATIEDLEIAASYVQGEGSALDRGGHPLAGKIAQIYDILSADEFYANADER